MIIKLKRDDIRPDINRVGCPVFEAISGSCRATSIKCWHNVENDNCPVLVDGKIVIVLKKESDESRNSI